MNRIGTRSRAIVLAVVLVMALLPSAATFAAQGEVAQPDPMIGKMPVIPIDALEGDRWSVDQVIAAPGQRLILTNRDVDRHNFSVAEWGIDVELLTLAPVEVIVPAEVEPGTSVTFASTRGNDREQGMEGTVYIVTPEQILAATEQQQTVSAAVANRMTVEIDDTFTFKPAELHLAPGALLEVRNVGSIEHHFVIDAWQLNETIGPGKIKLVQVPQDATVGETLDFYCSVPGHKELGMSGTLRIVPPNQGAETQPINAVGGNRVSINLRPFIPDSSVMGEEWTQLRTGNAGSIITGQTDFNAKVFPGTGLGAAYVGPAGSRVTIVVLPLRTDAVPVNQVKESIREVQASMMETWTTDRLSSAAMQRIPPPQGCDVALRASGLVPVLTLPAGSTVCELRNAGVVIFVAVEGGIDGTTGVEAADDLIARMLSGDTATEPITG